MLHVDAPLMATLATVVVGARLVQSAAHIASGSSLAVNVRFTAFATQLACFVAMLITIARSVR